MELERWFDSLAPDGAPRVDRLSEEERRELPAARADRRARLLHRRQRLRGARGVGAGAVSRGRPTPRTGCSRSTCCAPATRRRSCLARRCCTPTHTRPLRSCAAASTSGAGCARSTAGASRPLRCISPAGCAASWASRGASSTAQGVPAFARRATLAAVSPSPCRAPRRGAARLARRPAPRRACDAVSRWRGERASCRWSSTPSSRRSTQDETAS